MMSYYSFDPSTVTGTSVTNLANTDPNYPATLMNGAPIYTSEIMVGNGAVRFDVTKSQYITLPAFNAGTAGTSFT